MKNSRFDIVRLFALAFFAFTIASCGGGKSVDPLDPAEQEPEKSTKAELTSFTLQPGSTGLAKAITGYFSRDQIKFSIPESLDMAALKPTLKASDKATIYVGDQLYKEGDTYDLSNGAYIKVVSEAGTTSKIYSLKGEIGDNFIDTYIWKLMDQCSVPGVAFAVMKGSTVVYSKGYGWAVVDKEKVTPNTLFRMASISKQFCTMCIMRLKEEGKLKLDDKVFGDKGILKGIFRTTPYHETITVRHLLSHSSGICAGLDDPAFNSSYRYFGGRSSDPVPTDTLIQRTLDDRKTPYKNGSAEYSAGERYNYSNVGFCVLHRIVEVVSGKDYESFLREDVLAKMGVTDTYIGGYERERRSNECVVYSQGGGNGYANPLRNLAGAAGIITSTSQMMEILKHIDGDDDVPDFFTKETLAEMYTPYKYSGQDYNTYGLGWRMNNAKRFFGSHFHGGNMAGTATMWVGGATGDGKGNFSEKMSGAIICNSRSYVDNLTWDTSWGNSSSNDIDDSFYIILGEAFRYFK